MRQPIWWTLLVGGLLLLVLAAVGTIPGYVAAPGVGLLALSWSVLRRQANHSRGG